MTKITSKGKNKVTGQLLTQSFCCKEALDFVWLGAFLMINFQELAYVTVEELKYSAFLLSWRWLCLICEELRSSAVETRKHLRLIFKKTCFRAGFFVPFLEWSDDLFISTSCFWFTAFEYSNDFDFRYQIQPLWKSWRWSLIRNKFWCWPLLNLIKKRNSRTLLNKISSAVEKDP